MDNTKQLESILRALKAGLTVTLTNGDIQIGAVEIKNATTDTRAVVLAASTAAAAADTPLVVALHPTSPVPTGTNLIGQIQSLDIPDATTTYCPSLDTSAAYEASSISKASAGVLYGVFGYNSKTTGQYIQFFNSATVPADAAVPFIAPIFVPAQSNFSFDTGKFGLFFSAGISWSNSSTATTKTIGSADIFATVAYK
jgi:hypothetical protein